MLLKDFYFNIIICLLVLVKVGEVRAQGGGMKGMDVDYASAFDQDLYKRVIDAEKCEKQLEYLTNSSDVAMLCKYNERTKLNGYGLYRYCAQARKITSPFA